jgi:hypothetical protein
MRGLFLNRDLERGSTTTIDRRASVRYLSEHDAVTHGRASSNDVCLTAKIQDISHHGIGLILNEPVKAGTILNVELHGTPNRVPCFLLARVMWTGERPDGTLLAGCQFSRSLTENELNSIL